MMCPCGGMTKDHEYRTVDGVLHEVKTCKSCGRQMRVDWKNNKPIYRRG